MIKEGQPRPNYLGSDVRRREGCNQEGRWEYSRAPSQWWGGERGNERGEVPSPPIVQWVWRQRQKMSKNGGGMAEPPCDLFTLDSAMARQSTPPIQKYQQDLKGYCKRPN